MKVFEERRKIKRGLYSKPVLLALLVLVVVLGRAVWYSFKGRQIAGSNLEIANLERAEIGERMRSLEEDINKLNSERGKEEAFRSKLGMVKEGEGVIVLVNPEAEENLEEDKEESIWKRVKGFLGFE